MMMLKDLLYKNKKNKQNYSKLLSIQKSLKNFEATIDAERKKELMKVNKEMKEIQKYIYIIIESLSREILASEKILKQQTIQFTKSKDHYLEVNQKKLMIANQMGTVLTHHLMVRNNLISNLKTLIGDYLDGVEDYKRMNAIYKEISGETFKHENDRKMNDQLGFFYREKEVVNAEINQMTTEIDLTRYLNESAKKKKKEKENGIEKEEVREDPLDSHIDGSALEFKEEVKEEKKEPPKEEVKEVVKEEEEKKEPPKEEVKEDKEEEEKKEEPPEEEEKKEEEVKKEETPKEEEKKEETKEEVKEEEEPPKEEVKEEPPKEEVKEEEVKEEPPKEKVERKEEVKEEEVKEEPPKEEVKEEEKKEEVKEEVKEEPPKEKVEIKEKDEKEEEKKEEEAKEFPTPTASTASLIYTPIDQRNTENEGQVSTIEYDSD